MLSSGDNTGLFVLFVTSVRILIIQPNNVDKETNLSILSTLHK